MKLLEENESRDEGHFQVVQAQSAPVARQYTYACGSHTLSEGGGA